MPDLDLLRKLLTLPIQSGDKQESGRPAKAFDAWIAYELRRAGFPAGGIWPRAQRPRVLGDDVSALERKLNDLVSEFKRAEANHGKVNPPALRRAIREVEKHALGKASAYILGDFYAKQVDVGLSSWKRGPDLLISTKTMFSAYGKNLKNRHEEAVGEVASLRRRHPMAAMGYAYLVRQDILSQPKSYDTLYDILSRLRRHGETFDATLLLVVDWDDSDLAAGITVLDQPAADLGASQFFSDLIGAVMDRSPSSEHETVRRRHGGVPVGGLDPEDEDPAEA